MHSPGTADSRGPDRRRDPRIEVPAAYTAVEVRRLSTRRRSALRGHATDVSAGGLAFEVDEPLEPGERVEIRVELLNAGVMKAIRATGSIVRQTNPDDPGPARLAVAFDPEIRPRVTAELARAMG